MPLPVLDFWFDFASTYSYLAAMRIGPLARKAEVRVRFRPFLLGPIFKAQGWSTSPFNLYPAKGRHMWRDLERSCADLQLAFRRPDPFRRTVCSRPAWRWWGSIRRGAKSSAARSFARNSPMDAASTIPPSSATSWRDL